MAINEKELAAYTFILSNGVNCPSRKISMKILDKMGELTKEDHFDIKQFLQHAGKCCVEACVAGAIYETFLGIQKNILKSKKQID